MLCWICSKVTIKILERRQFDVDHVFIAKFDIRFNTKLITLV